MKRMSLLALLIPAVANGAEFSAIEIRSRHCDVQVRAGPLQIPEDVRQRRVGDRLVLETDADQATIQVPRVALRIALHAGDVDVQGDFREIELRTASGDIKLDADAERMDIKTLSGDVRLEGAVADLDVEAISGNLELRLRQLQAKRMRSQTTNGSISLRSNSLPQSVDIQTVNGEVEIAGDLAKEGELRVRTMSGAIDWVRTKPEGNISARSRSGSVRIDGQAPSAAAGDHRVELVSFSGDISVKSQTKSATP